MGGISPFLSALLAFLAILAFSALTLRAATTLTLVWDANTDGVTTTYVLHKTVGNVTTAVTNVAHPTVTATIPAEAPGVAASYYLTAKSAQGLESGPSNSVIFTNPAPLALPSAIASLTGTVTVQIGTVTQTLSWPASPPAELVTQYVVRRYDAAGTMVQSATTTGASFVMQFPQATMRTDVVAVNATGASPPRSFSLTQPRVPFNARLTVTN